jgi:hypothetical protein
VATRYHSLTGLGVSLHYLQDTFSHAGYTNSNFGHSPLSWIDDFPFGKYGDHSTDKTASDVEKALRMAKYSYGQIAKFGQEQCGCTSNPWNQSMEDTIRRFSKVNTLHPAQADIEGNVYGDTYNPDLADPAALLYKRLILGVDER